MVVDILAGHFSIRRLEIRSHRLSELPDLKQGSVQARILRPKVNVWKSYSWSYGVFLDLLFVIYRFSVSLSREDLTCLRDVVPATASGSKTSLKKQAEGEEKLGMVSALCPGKDYTHLAVAALLGERSASAQRRNDVQILVMMARPRLKRALACI